MVDGSGFGVRISAHIPNPQVLGMWLWTGLFTFVSFSFFICPMKLINVTDTELV